MGVGEMSMTVCFSFSVAASTYLDMKVVCTHMYECAYMHVYMYALPLQEILGTELLLHLESGLAAMV